MSLVNERILPISPARSGKKLRAFAGVTIHETANASPTATAKNHMRYMTQNGGKNKEVSYHYVVDETEAWHLIPDDEVAWHAGDGAGGKGNNETVAIEICVNSGADFEKAVQNAAEVAARVLYAKGQKEAKLFEHHDFSPWGKSCPAQLRAGQAGGMAALRQATSRQLSGLWQKEDAAQGSEMLWRVQCGAFAKKENAALLAKRLAQAGFDAVLTQTERI